MISTYIKKVSKTTLLLSLVLVICIACGCEKLDEDYGESMPVESSISETEETKLIYPEIKSFDDVMPKYFDISHFDEENYSKIYLGKKFKFNITYAGSVITVPTSYSKMQKLGWQISLHSKYGDDAVIMAGKNIEVELCNEYGNLINAVFYNASKSSKKLVKCNIVKFIIPENSLNVDESSYGQFWINGINNQSAINNVVEFFGIPSHFYRVSANHYYLDYFFSDENKRSGITVHVDPENDIILSVEFSNYD
ncbi:MAG: hypothetical protein E7561_00415 [Ruminococcaceae bacterium]|nr:hypothetical protein [Oscillospiraceae bacterium]